MTPWPVAPAEVDLTHAPRCPVGPPSPWPDRTYLLVALAALVVGAYEGWDRAGAKGAALGVVAGVVVAAIALSAAEVVVEQRARRYRTGAISFEADAHRFCLCTRCASVSRYHGVGPDKPAGRRAALETSARRRLGRDPAREDERLRTVVSVAPVSAGALGECDETTREAARWASHVLTALDCAGRVQVVDDPALVVTLATLAGVPWQVWSYQGLFARVAVELSMTIDPETAIGLALAATA